MFLTESTSTKVSDISPTAILESLLEFHEEFEEQKYEIVKLEHEIALQEQELLLTEAMDMNALGASAKDNSKTADVEEKKKTFGDKAKGVWETIVKFVKAIGVKIATVFRNIMSKISAYLLKAKNFVKSEAQIEDPAPEISRLEDAIEVAKVMANAETTEQVNKFKEKLKELSTSNGPRKGITVKKEQAEAYVKKIEELGKTLDSTVAASLRAVEAKAAQAKGDAGAVKQAASGIVEAAHKGMSLCMKLATSIMSKFK